MSIEAERRRIRVLYLGRSPDLHEFTLRLCEGRPEIKLTSATQPDEVGNLLRGGFDCIVIEEGKPYIDAEKVAKAIRAEGFSSLPVIVHRGVGRSDDEAERLADAIRKARRRPSAETVERGGFSSSPIG